MPDSTPPGAYLGRSGHPTLGSFEPTVAMPAVSMVQSSDLVMFLMCGFTVKADSTPTKMLLAVVNASAPDIFMRVVNILAKNRIIRGMILQ